MSSIINTSKWIVKVKRRPDLNRAFPDYKGTEAKAYKEKLLSEDKLVAEIVRGPLKLFVRVRTRGRPPQYLRVHSYRLKQSLNRIANRRIVVNYKNARAAIVSGHATHRTEW